MRHIIPLTICTVAVGGLVSGAYVGHHQAVHQQNLRNAQTASLHAKQAVQAKMTAEKQESQTQATINKLETSCKQGLTAYNSLTATTKAHVAKPDCSQ